jgi:hypothetical protein
MRRGRFETALRWFILICILILLGHMFWYGWAMAARAQVNIHPTLGISMMWAFISIPVGAVFAMIAVIAHHLDPPTPIDHRGGLNDGRAFAHRGDVHALRAERADRRGDRAGGDLRHPGDGGVNPIIIGQQLYVSLNKFPLVAIPFFILAGNLMNTGGISRRLVDFARVLVGNTQGGLAATCVVTCMFFAAVSGSSTATTFAIGAIMIPALVKAGYPRPGRPRCRRPRPSSAWSSRPRSR